MNANLRRKRSPKNCLSQLTCLRLSAEEMSTVEQFAIEELRSRASFLRILILLGLEEFKHKRMLNSLSSQQDKRSVSHSLSTFIAGK